MKKLFSILTTVGLSLTASISTVSCMNSNNNYKGKDDQTEFEKNELAFQEKMNNLLDDLEWEFTDDGSTHIIGKKSKLDIVIGDADKHKADKDQFKIFKTVKDVTKSLWTNNHNYENDMVEIITGFYFTKTNEPQEYELDNEAKVPMPQGTWSYRMPNYIQGSITMKGTGKNKGVPKDVYWKMRYLKQNSYYANLYGQAMSWYFDNEDYHNQPDSAFELEKDVEFVQNWVKKIIKDYIKDENLQDILITLYKGVKTELGIDDGVNGWVDVPNGVWDPNNPDPQWINITVLIIDNGWDLTIWLKSKA